MDGFERFVESNRRFGPPGRSRDRSDLAPDDDAEPGAPERDADEERPEMPAGGPVVLVVDDDAEVRGYVRQLLEKEGYEVREAGSGDEALAQLGEDPPDAMLLDLNLPETSGFDVLEEAGTRQRLVPTVVVSALDDVETVVRAMKLGAMDYVTKPFEVDELTMILARVIPPRNLRQATEQFEADELPSEPTPRPFTAPGNEQSGTDPLVRAFGDSECFFGVDSMRRVWELIRQIADTDVPVLITGESGVGKDLVARAIHGTSSRRDQLFVKINCAALPATLLESELFGHERGAFTGATRERAGKFELAHKGTIFLDEIGEMPVDLQAKLLQALQDEEFYRVGGKRPVRVDVRVVAATNKELSQAMREGSFREDLYFRLNVVHISVPPLRARREEVGPLIEFFLRKYASRYRKDGPPPALPPALHQKLLAYSWPGNVRQLENVIRRWVVLRDERYVLEELRQPTPDDADKAAAEGTPEAPEPTQPLSLLDIGRRAAREAEKVAIVETLTRTGWNKRRAAAELQVSYKALLYKIKECGIVSPHAAAAAAAARRSPTRPT